MKYGMNFVVNTTKEWKYVNSHCMMYANTFTQWIMLKIYICRDMTNELMKLVSVKQKLASENKQYVKGPRGLSPTLVFPIHPPRINKCKIISSIWYRTSSSQHTPFEQICNRETPILTLQSHKQQKIIRK